MKCTNCGNEMAQGAKFCTVCGAKAPDVCAVCGEPLKEGVKFCTKCGAAVMPQQEDQANREETRSAGNRNPET